jgi:hypothetical protein
MFLICPTDQAFILVDDNNKNNNPKFFDFIGASTTKKELQDKTSFDL